MADFGPMVRDAQSSRTGHRAPGTGHLDALLRSIENNLTARDD
ncbi:hypothetical protein [Candidatus Microthrix parvicella]|nr:hypothetical protein [Candidatus Microthrix parvicella]